MLLTFIWWCKTFSILSFLLKCNLAVGIVCHQIFCNIDIYIYIYIYIYMDIYLYIYIYIYLYIYIYIFIYWSQLVMYFALEQWSRGQPMYLWAIFHPIFVCKFVYCMWSITNENSESTLFWWLSVVTLDRHVRMFTVVFLHMHTCTCKSCIRFMTRRYHFYSLWKYANKLTLFKVQQLAPGTREIHDIWF